NIASAVRRQAACRGRPPRPGRCRKPWGAKLEHDLLANKRCVTYARRVETAISTSLVLNLAALASLLPAALVRWRREDARDGVFFVALTLAAIGPLAWAASQLGGAWRTGFATSLWITIAATMVLFVFLAAATRHAWRLASGPLAWAASQLGGAWRTGFATSLWITIAATMVLFVFLAAATRHAWRLAALLL